MLLDPGKRTAPKTFAETEGRRDHGWGLHRVPGRELLSDRELQNGATSEAIRLDYPALNLDQVYGAITFYLANKEEVEREVVEATAH